MTEVTVKANKSIAATVSFSSPIALSKVRAMWFKGVGQTFGVLAGIDGNLSADQVYQIRYDVAFIPTETDTRTQVTIKPTLYITMEE